MADEFLDLNGEVRLQGTLVAPGGLLPGGGATGEVLTKASDADGDADWEAGGAFNGGTITGALTIHPSTDADALVLIPHDSGDDALHVKDAASNTLLEITDGSLFDFTLRAGDNGRFRVLSGGVPVFNLHDAVGVQELGLFGATPAIQQTLTSGTATPEQIALALQANGFCGGT